MDWFSDAVDKVTQTVSAPVQAVTAPVFSVASKVPGLNVVSDAVQSNVNNMLNPVGSLTSIYQGVTNPLQSAKSISQGAIGTVALGQPITALGSDPTFQSVLRNNGLDSITQGYAGNFAGYSAGVNKFANGQDMTNQEQNDSIQFGVKTGALGVVGGGIGYAVTPITAGGLGWGIAAPSATGVLAAGAIAKDLGNGNIQGAAGDSGVTGFLNDISPGLGDTLTGNLSNGSSPAPVSSAFSNPAAAFSSPAVSSGISIGLVAIAGLGIFFLLKKRGLRA